MSGSEYLLDVRGLRASYFAESGVVRAVDDVSFRIAQGEVLGLVGESGCGKSATGFSILRLMPPPGSIVGGEILFEGRDLLSLTEKEMQKVRGARIGLVFQEPASALNPVLTIGYQVGETLMIHRGLSRKQAASEAELMLAEVAIPDPARRVREYPHQLSGGMVQRVMLAIALIARPALLIADEPTTALDVTIQAQILDLLKRLRDRHGLTVLLITHDLGVIAEMADRVAVMYAGKIVEEAKVADLFRAPMHPYTEGLMRSVIGIAGPGAGAEARSTTRRLHAIPGNVPDLARLPGGCAFHPRCPDVMAECREHAPPLVVTESAGNRRVACFKHRGVAEPPPPVAGSGWNAALGR